MDEHLRVLFPPSLVKLALVLLISVCIAYSVQQTFCSPLKSIPGPALAKFTNLWQAVLYYRGKQASVIRHLHDRHGPVVRLGPHHISVNDRSLIKTIYSLRGNYIKSEWYQATDDHTPVLFSTRDEE
ncbi:MAG: hypothetical protein Q9218_000562 [Villophora microphyllina]